ncbi:Shedu anti-phage system protein SduA domain-containing protein [Actinoplanes couchii]|uniref:Shedu protein SduA C-terminal domain-containing protein n=1 Tax=Actinoplanes couchii TaxID=403638 RepID=A0ABQ3X9M2_9ACTN|nr:Shedu anti-phage system protein SduA domain-containing protein [Actinoplanes couchii]MDR6325706.1 hypothetical protein [Actinoplanes couchii]GID55125.1 hypothetical protein Aco03nite_035290 [Actinoplanes couchii]
MRIRSDSTLNRLLRKILELGPTENVRPSVEDVLRHVGDRSPYRGGKELTELLRAAFSRARSEHDDATAERIEDALGYAMNTLLRPDLEAKYQLLDGSRRRGIQLIEQVTVTAARFVTDQADRYHEENPGTNAEQLLAFLRDLPHFEISEALDDPGTYRMARGMDEGAVWAERTIRHCLRFEDEAPILDADDLASAPLSMLIEVAQLRLRQRSLAEFESTVLSPHSTEHDLQKVLERNLWIFGGTYLPKTATRRLVPGAEFDLPLLRPDGSMHVVELKRANVPLLTHQRGWLVPNDHVHRAVAQVTNYLVALDESAPRLLTDSGLDTRRVTATVVIGHPEFGSEEKNEQAVNRALRIFNGNHARIEVITYKQLLDGAKRSLTYKKVAD